MGRKAKEPINEEHAKYSGTKANYDNKEPYKSIIEVIIRNGNKQLSFGAFRYLLLEKLDRNLCKRFDGTELQQLRNKMPKFKFGFQRLHNAISELVKEEKLIKDKENKKYSLIEKDITEYYKERDIEFIDKTKHELIYSPDGEIRLYGFNPNYLKEIKVDKQVIRDNGKIELGKRIEIEEHYYEEFKKINERFKETRNELEELKNHARIDLFEEEYDRKISELNEEGKKEIAKILEEERGDWLSKFFMWGDDDTFYFIHFREEMERRREIEPCIQEILNSTYEKIPFKTMVVLEDF